MPAPARRCFGLTDQKKKSDAACPAQTVPTSNPTLATEQVPANQIRPSLSVILQQAPKAGCRCQVGGTPGFDPQKSSVPSQSPWQKATGTRCSVYASLCPVYWQWKLVDRSTDKAMEHNGRRFSTRSVDSSHLAGLTCMCPSQG